MSMLWSLSQFILGLILLYFGAEFFLKGAVRLARSFGVSPYLIGLTLVGFGTSAPELAINLAATLGKANDLAIGNVVGSNIANIGLILGVCALVRPLVVQLRIIKREAPILLFVTFGFVGLAWDGRLDRLDAGVLLAGFAAMTAYIYFSAETIKPEGKDELAIYSKEVGKSLLHWDVLLIALGLAGLVGGAELMVRSAVELARMWGMSELMIGLTIVAIGTSLPELASSALAAYRGETDIAVGNVIGSNLFNILLILGTTSMVQPLEVTDHALRVDIPLMLGFTLLLIPVLWRSFRVTRMEGVLLLTCYAGYLVFQIVQAQWP